MKTAIYARVSTFDQEPENQLRELRRYVEARGWTAAVEYVDKGSADRRTSARRSTCSSGMRSGARSTSSSAGGSTGSAGI
jgi:hypothetical protein